MLGTDKEDGRLAKDTLRNRCSLDGIGRVDTAEMIRQKVAPDGDEPLPPAVLRGTV